jgi:hypothetical protein
LVTSPLVLNHLRRRFRCRCQRCLLCRNWCHQTSVVDEHRHLHPDPSPSPNTEA